MLEIFKKAVQHQGGLIPLLKKTVWVIRNLGFKGVLYRIRFLGRHSSVFRPPSEIYLYRSPELTPAIKEQIEGFSYQPLISVIMPVYNVDGKWLRKAYDSLQNQWYTNWELCICDDASDEESTVRELERIEKEARVKLHWAKQNGNISKASNLALDLAEGEYIALMDHDDELTCDALFEIVQSLQAVQHDFVYSDEDKIEDSGHFSEPHFKPDFCPDYFLSTNYLSHLGVIKRELVQAVGGWTVGVEGAQDYDLYLKVLEKTSAIHHIPKVLYHWRKVAGSTAVSFDEKSSARESGRLAVEQHIARLDLDAKVVQGIQPGTYRVRYALPEEPLVSIVIPFRDKFNLLSVCLNSILAYDKYENFEVICVDNGSQEVEIDNLKRHFARRDQRIRFVDFDFPFNYSEINNWAVREHCKGEYIVFMNNDIEIIDDDWLLGLLELCQIEEIGAVGAKLLYPATTIQHAGILLSPNSSNATINAFQHQGSMDVGYFSRPQCISNYSAVTAALMMVSKVDFDQVGGFDDERLKIAYNDVDLCLRLGDLGRRVVYTPFVTAFHHESASRGNADSADKLDALGRELQALKNKHPEKFERTDKHFNPNLAGNRFDFGISPKVSRDYQRFIMKPFPEIKATVHRFREVSKRDVCVFAHYDRQGKIAPYVVYLLEAIAAKFDIVMVSTAKKFDTSELEKVSGLCATLIQRENVGYDFGSWKVGLQHLLEQQVDISNLLIANDSCFGPLQPLESLLGKWSTSGTDAFGVTDSYETRHHLQSYFILFNQRVVKSPSFIDFWERLGVVEDKQQLIFEFEIGLTQVLKRDGLSVGCLAPSEEIGYLNNTHMRWKELLENYRSPFVKIELLRDNPLGRDLSQFVSVVERNSNYPMKLMREQLSRSRVDLNYYQTEEHVKSVQIN